MRKLSLGDTWKCTERMWKWVAFQKEVLEVERTVDELKKVWLEENAPEFLGMTSNCFFCYSGISDGCHQCPGRLVDSFFGCTRTEYDYANKPGAFYREILRLDAIRTAEPEPTFKVGDVFYRDAKCDSGHYIQLKSEDGKVGLVDFLGELSHPTYDNSMTGYYKVTDLNAITMTEVQSMTNFLKGLRLVSIEKLHITETD